MPRPARCRRPAAAFLSSQVNSQARGFPEACTAAWGGHATDTWPMKQQGSPVTALRTLKGLQKYALHCLSVILSTAAAVCCDGQHRNSHRAPRGDYEEGLGQSNIVIWITEHTTGSPTLSL